MKDMVLTLEKHPGWSRDDSTISNGAMDYFWNTSGSANPRSQVRPGSRMGHQHSETKSIGLGYINMIIR